MKGECMKLRWIAVLAIMLFAGYVYAGENVELKDQKDKVSYSIGINIGKKIGNTQEIPLPSPTTYPSTSLKTGNLQPTNIPPSPSSTPLLTGKLEITTSPNENIQGTSSITIGQCGFQITLPSSFVREETSNQQTYIYADKDNPDAAIATTCAAEIPRPPVLADKIESIILDGTEGTLYHDTNPQGAKRDEVIVAHPSRNLEIIIAGFGSIFDSAISSFKFID